MKIEAIADVWVGAPLARYKADPIQSVETRRYQVISQSMLSPTGFLATPEPEYFDSDKDLSHYCAQAGDIVMALREPNHAVYICEQSAGLLLKSYYALVRCDPKVVLPRYLAFVLNTPAVQKQLNKNTQGSMIQLAKVQDIKAIELNLPRLEKQQQIVALLEVGYQEIEVLHALIEAKSQLLQSIISHQHSTI